MTKLPDNVRAVMKRIDIHLSDYEISRDPYPLHASDWQTIRDYLVRVSRPVTEREPPHCPTCECGMEPGELARIVAAAREG